MAIDPDSQTQQKVIKEAGIKVVMDAQNIHSPRQ